MLFAAAAAYACRALLLMLMFTIFLLMLLLRRYDADMLCRHYDVAAAVMFSAMLLLTLMPLDIFIVDTSRFSLPSFATCRRHAAAISDASSRFAATPFATLLLLSPFRLFPHCHTPCYAATISSSPLFRFSRC